jgi:hypothetical protein
LPSFTTLSKLSWVGITTISIVSKSGEWNMGFHEVVVWDFMITLAKYLFEI